MRSVVAITAMRPGGHLPLTNRHLIEKVARVSFESHDAAIPLGIVEALDHIGDIRSLIGNLELAAARAVFANSVKKFTAMAVDPEHPGHAEELIDAHSAMDEHAAAIRRADPE